MKFTNTLTDEAILQEMGQRIGRYRLNQDKPQAALAQEAGVSLRTLARFEAGESVQASSLIRILRALQLLDNLESLVPAPVSSPIQQYRLQGKQRQRASSTSDKDIQEAPWSWGDDE